MTEIFKTIFYFQLCVSERYTSPQEPVSLSKSTLFIYQSTYPIFSKHYSDAVSNLIIYREIGIYKREFNAIQQNKDIGYEML